jgi:hypothetical protein
MTIPRSNAAAIGAYGILYVFGGFDGHSGTDSNKTATQVKLKLFLLKYVFPIIVMLRTF